MDKSPVEPRLRRHQRGVATILTILLVGLALTASVLGVMYHIRAAQDELLTVHAQTQAQLRAWTGVQLAQKYLDGIQSDKKLTDLVTQIGSGPLSLAITNDNGANLTGINMKLVSVDNAADPKIITAEIVGTAAEGNAAESRSVLRVVYALNTSTAPNPFPAPGTFNKGLKGSGSNKFRSDSGMMLTITVKGDYDGEDGNSIDGLDDLLVTGSISIGSGSSFKTLRANCDVKITGSVTGKSILAGRNACLDGGTSGADIVANNNIASVGTYDKTNSLSAGGSIPDYAVEACKAANRKYDCPAFPKTNADNTPTSSRLVIDLGEGGGAKAVNAKGDVRMRTGHIGSLLADGDLYFTWTPVVDSGKISGSLKPSQNVAEMSKNVHVTTSSGLSVTIPTNSQVTVDTIVINAYDYRSSANYDFHIKDGFKRISVKNVNGIDSDEYYLVGTTDLLCPSSKLKPGSTSDNPQCTVENAKLKTLCMGNSAYNGCFSYDAKTRTWRVDGTSMAQGVAWFEGNLTLVGGGANVNEFSGGSYYFNTFVATGNIDNSGSTKVYAPNYAGYDGAYQGTTYAPRGICSNNYFVSTYNIYPTQFCKDGKFVADISLANYALLSGSVPEGTTYAETTYVGGNITTGASSEVFGNVLAGNQLQTTGASLFHGSASAMGNASITKNNLSASTEFRLTNLPPTFNDGSQSPKDPGKKPGTSGFTIKWATYL